MRIILLAFVSFIVAGVFLLPFINEQLELPAAFYLYGPLSLMALSVIIQIDWAFTLRRLLKARQISLENDSLQAELKDVTGKLHTEKKALTDFKSQLAAHERDLRQLHTRSTKLTSELAQAEADKKKLTAAVDEALRQEREASAKLAKLRERSGSSNRELLHLLALLQEKGRFVDFLMDDITKYPDPQVGAAARLVHRGCAQVMADYFDISPLADQQEGSQISIGEDYHPKEYRFLGRVGEPPFQGTILHRGWCTRQVKLPQWIEDQDGEALASGAQVIAPAEVELA